MAVAARASERRRSKIDQIVAVFVAFRSAVTVLLVDEAETVGGGALV